MPRHNYAKLLHVIVTDHCMCLVCKRTCTHSNSVCHVYVQGTNIVHTVHVLTMCMQLQASADPAVMKTFRRVVLCHHSLQSLMMRRGIIIPAVRTKSFPGGARWGRHGQGNNQIFGWNGGARAQLLQGPAQFSWSASMSNCWEGRTATRTVNVAQASFTGRLPSKDGCRGTEKIHTVWTTLVQTCIGIQVLVLCMYHVHTLYIHCTYHSMFTYTLYIHCS
jgi:hypothetical protein